jgi:hypothetical protein
MRLTSVETTPNPNSMKLNLDESAGKAITYTPDQREGCPEFVSTLLDIEGINSVFVCQDFLTLNKDPRMDWRPILNAASQILTGPEQSDTVIDQQRQAAEKLGQVSVYVQTFRGIPIQVKVVDAEGETRIALDERFAKAAESLLMHLQADYLKERYWADRGSRYGSRDEVAAEVTEEIQGAIDTQDLEQIVAASLGKAIVPTSPKTPGDLRSDLESEDWHRRLRAVQDLGSSDDTVLVLIKMLKDPNAQVRRLAAAALGASGSPTAVEPLCEALLNDSSVGVRRTAGDALSDLGSDSAQPAACGALGDPNRLVRWRAARILADVGTEEALPYLQKAVSDPEFEVRLEVEAAIKRISAGQEGSMPVWKKILKDTQANT